MCFTDFIRDTNGAFFLYVPTSTSISIMSNQLHRKNITLPSFVGCQVPMRDDLTLAFLTCVGTVSSLCTPDFYTYILPAAQCLLGNVTSTAFDCITCLGTAYGTGAFVTEVCEEDDSLSKLTASGCNEGIAEGTEGCVCNACGDVCGSACKPELQQALLCQFGAELEGQSPDAGRLFSGLQQNANNANFPEGQALVLKENFTCEYEGEE